MTADELSAKLTELETTVTSLTKRAEDAEYQVTLAKLGAKDQEAHSEFSETEQQAFRAAPEAERTAMLAKARATIQKRNDEASQMPELIRKQFETIEKALAQANARAEVAEAVAKKARDISELAELAKRAEAEFSGLPGTADEKAVILKALCTKLSPEERMGVESLLKAGNACLAAGMRDVGKASPQGTGGDSWAQIETLAKARAAKDGIPQAEAVCKVLDENPELYTAYVSTSK